VEALLRSPLAASWFIAVVPCPRSFTSDSFIMSACFILEMFKFLPSKAKGKILPVPN
jgi:hypothetical protein